MSDEEEETEMFESTAAFLKWSSIRENDVSNYFLNYLNDEKYLVPF